MRSGVPPPERMFDALHGRWVPEPMRGLVFAFEIGGVDRGWLLDCSRGSDAVVSRFAAGGAVWPRGYRREIPPSGGAGGLPPLLDPPRPRGSCYCPQPP